MQCFVIWCLLCVCACLMANIQSVDCVELVHLCEQGSNGSFPEPVHIVNADFPHFVTQKQCACSFIANTYLTVTLRLLIVFQRQEGKPFPLTITYREDNRKTIVDSLLKLQMLGFEDAGIIVARNVTDLDIEMAHGTNVTQVRFMLNIATPEDIAGHIIISCKSEDATGNDADENSGSGDSENNEVHKFIEKLCSPFLLILLISVCVALLLIILMVSTILCCVMPRTQRQQIEKIRQSMSLDADPALAAKGADRIRPDTMIYENVDKSTSFSRTLPMDRRGQECAKTAYKQSNLYQNI